MEIGRNFTVTDLKIVGESDEEAELLIEKEKKYLNKKKIIMVVGR